MPGAGHWSAHQLAEFLSAVSGHRDRSEAISRGVEQAGEALEAEVAAFLDDGTVVAAVGFPASGTPEAELLAAASAGGGQGELPGLGICSVGLAAIGQGGTQRLLVARQGDDGYTREEDQLLRGMAQVLDMTLDTLGVLESERAVRLRTRKIIKDPRKASTPIAADGVVRDWNGAAETTFGWARDEALGNRLSELIVPPGLRAAHERGIKRFVSTRERRVMETRRELTALHRDGREFPVEFTIAPIADGSTWTFNAFLRDISERKRAEAQLEQRAAQQAAVAGLGRLALEGAEPIKLMKEAVRVVTETLQIDRVELLELLDEGDAATVRAGVGEGSRLDLADRPQAQSSVEQEQAIVVEDWDREERFSVQRTDVASGMTVVIHGPERPFGILGAHSTAHRLYTDDELNFVQSVANVLAEAIERR